MTQDNKSRARWTGNDKGKKTRALTTRTKQIVRTIFLSGQKGVYHQVEFCRIEDNMVVVWEVLEIRLGLLEERKICQLLSNIHT